MHNCSHCTKTITKSKNSKAKKFMDSIIDNKYKTIMGVITLSALIVAIVK